jgi:hypothetical protein
MHFMKKLTLLSIVILLFICCLVLGASLNNDAAGKKLKPSESNIPAIGVADTEQEAGDLIFSQLMSSRLLIFSR